MKLDAFASQSHYLDHLAPVWRALHPSVRGQLVVPPTLLGYAQALGLATVSSRVDRERPVLVASFVDERATHPSPVILLEHGAGQHYEHPAGARTLGDPGGSRRRRRLVAYLGPNERCVDRFAETHPSVAGFVVGCPKLADLASSRAKYRADARFAEQPRPPVVAFAWHWDVPVLPEARSAHDHWAADVVEFARSVPPARPIDVVGHGHPRAWHQLAPWYRHHSIRAIPQARQLLAEVDVLVADNTSLIFEAAALDVPVILLDAPWYRREVEHGLRFWKWADVGPRLRPGQRGTSALAETILRVLLDPAEHVEQRAACTVDVYAYTDEAAAAAAAAACADVASGIERGAGRRDVAGHDPFRGTRPGVAPQIAPPSGDELRLRIRAWFEFHQITANAGQIAAWASMSDSELADAFAQLQTLTPGDVEQLRTGRAVDVTGMTETGPPPEDARARIEWIGDDPDRARVAFADERQRGTRQRTTVLDAIARVLSNGTS